MLMALFSMLIRLALTCFMLAMRLVVAVAALLGTLLGHLILALWRIWRNRNAGKIPLRAPKQIEAGETERQAPPPAVTITTFTPRPLRPRPKR